MTKIKCLICWDVLVGDRMGTFFQCSCENIYIDEVSKQYRLYQARNILCNIQ